MAEALETEEETGGVGVVTEVSPETFPEELEEEGEDAEEFSEAEVGVGTEVEAFTEELGEGETEVDVFSVCEDAFDTPDREGSRACEALALDPKRVSLAGLEPVAFWFGPDSLAEPFRLSSLGLEEARGTRRGKPLESFETGGRRLDWFRKAVRFCSTFALVSTRGVGVGTGVGVT